MMSKNFIEHINYLLRHKLHNFTKYNPHIRESSIILINEFLLELESNRMRIPALLNGSQRERSFIKTNGTIEVEFVLNPTGNSKIRISLIQSEVELISLQKMQKFIEVKSGFVYLVYSQYGYKIGMSTNLDNRRKRFDVKLPFPVEMKYYVKSDNYKAIEKELHTLLDDYRLNGEWFNLNITAVKKILTFCADNSLTIKRYTNG